MLSTPLSPHYLFFCSHDGNGRITSKAKLLAKAVIVLLLFQACTDWLHLQQGTPCGIETHAYIHCLDLIILLDTCINFFFLFSQKCYF